jgi:choline dehydrogenase-like flavoprotein
VTSRVSIDTPARSYDAIVIGSGAGGATLALRIAQAGRKVLVVERGDWFVPTKPDRND